MPNGACTAAQGPRSRAAAQTASCYLSSKHELLSSKHLWSEERCNAADAAFAAANAAHACCVRPRAETARHLLLPVQAMMTYRRSALLACSLLLLLPVSEGFSSPSAGLARDLSRRRLHAHASQRSPTPLCGLRMQRQAEPPKGPGYACSATACIAMAYIAPARSACSETLSVGADMPVRIYIVDTGVET
jgi:hypothetical protein